MPKPALRPQAFEPSKAEWRIKELHDEGISVSAIAAQLNREGEATLSGRGQWRHKLVLALMINEAQPPE